MKLIGTWVELTSRNYRYLALLFLKCSLSSLLLLPLSFFFGLLAETLLFQLLLSNELFFPLLLLLLFLKQFLPSSFLKLLLSQQFFLFAYLLLSLNFSLPLDLCLPLQF